MLSSGIAAIWTAIFPMNNCSKPGETVLLADDETEYEVERLTLDELAERINDECFNDTEDYVRFIQMTD